MKETKTNHRTGYHKPIKNPTHNVAPDSHKAFCERRFAKNGGCPDNRGKLTKSRDCNV